MTTRHLLVLIAASEIACAAPAKTANSAAEPPAASVSVVRAELRDIPTLYEAGGIVRSGTSAAIASRILAPIVEVLVRPGDRVRRGAALVRLDAREMQAGRTRAAAALVAGTETVRAAESDVVAAEAAERLARQTGDRIDGLYAKRSATAQERDDAAAAVAAARARLDAARARHAAAIAARDVAHAALDGADVSASYGVLTAPFDGVITARSADPGAMAVPGAPLLTIEDPRVWRLEVQLDEARADVQVGDAVDTRIDNETDGAGWRPARIAEISRIDAASHTFTVKIDLEDGHGLRSGLFARARFRGVSRRALTVPASAIVVRGQLTFVFLVDAGRRARLQPITAASPLGDRVEVRAGLNDGDPVVLAPPDNLVDGSPVIAEGARAPSSDGAGR